MTADGCAVQVDSCANHLGAFSLDDRGVTSIIAAGQRQTGDQVEAVGSKPEISVW